MTSETIENNKCIFKNDQMKFSSEDEKNTKNKLNLIFSRSSTNKKDRRKIELFWKYFDKQIDSERLLKGSNQISITTVEVEAIQSDTIEEPNLCGNTYRGLADCNNEAIRTIKVLKSKHMDELALINVPPVAKIEGSPYLADEIIIEDNDVVENAIKTFEKMKKEKGPKLVKRSDCKRESHLIINRLGLKNLQP